MASGPEIQARPGEPSCLEDFAEGPRAQHALAGRGSCNLRQLVLESSKLYMNKNPKTDTGTPQLSTPPQPASARLSAAPAAPSTLPLDSSVDLGALLGL